MQDQVNRTASVSSINAFKIMLLIQSLLYDLPCKNWKESYVKHIKKIPKL